MNRFLPPAVLLIACLSGSGSARAVESDASEPKGVNIAVYDAGFALVNEVRSLTLAKGENRIRFHRLPSHLDLASVSFLLLPESGRGLQVMEQQFEYDLGDVTRLFSRYLGKTVEVKTGSGSVKGSLLAAPAGSDEAAKCGSLAVKLEDGSISVLSCPGSIQEVVFPEASRTAYTEPVLLWRAGAAEEGPLKIRLLYTCGGMSWNASYDMVLSESGTEGSLSVRANLANRSGGDYHDARVKLISTEKGSFPPILPDRPNQEGEAAPAAPALRYGYGIEQPDFERSVAGQALLSTYDLPDLLNIEDGDNLYIQLRSFQKVPVARLYVYDGVKFDRFQRNRRNDWNYGTEFQRTVETYVEFKNTKALGMGVDLPPGQFRLYQQRADGSMDLVGQDVVPATSAEKAARIRLGPARGISGERERTGYTELTPLHEYEESFEIRLENSSPDEAEVRVVEHLYRWNQFEIVKADSDYTATGLQTIEFRPVIKAGGKRSIHYTVRYRW